jgi:6-pyruvoyltetrahydropterin/6-carboxytetrahydropterin synthase
MYEVTIKKSFSAAHVLKEIGGKCEDLHGHNFLVEVSVAGDALNGEDLLIDFRDLKKWINEILDHLDHKYLNEVAAFKDMNPSSERVAKFIYDRLKEKIQTLNLGLMVSSVTVWESDNARVTYYTA